MAYNEKINNRIREALFDLSGVEEKHMFGGVCYMVNGKMCVGVVKDEMMCRIDSAEYENALGRQGCREMDFTDRAMKGFVYVDETGIKTQKDLNYWITLCLEFNQKAKASKKRSNKSTKN
jgi:TfoX/Sxy family transcriptional regulator of competence genes